MNSLCVAGITARICDEEGSQKTSSRLVVFFIAYFMLVIAASAETTTDSPTAGQIIDNVLSLNEELDSYEASVTSVEFASREEYQASLTGDTSASQPRATHKVRYDNRRKLSKVVSQPGPSKATAGAAEESGARGKPFFSTDVVRFLAATKDFANETVLGEEKLRGRECYKLRIDAEEGGTEVATLIWVDKEFWTVLRSTTNVNGKTVIDSEFDYKHVPPDIWVPKEARMFLHQSGRFIQQIYSEHILHKR